MPAIPTPTPIPTPVLACDESPEPESAVGDAEPMFVAEDVLVSGDVLAADADVDRVVTAEVNAATLEDVSVTASDVVEDVLAIE